MVKFEGCEIAWIFSSGHISFRIMKICTQLHDFIE